MKPKWLIEQSSSLEDDDLVKALGETGTKYQFLKFQPFTDKREGLDIFKPEDCVIFRGSINSAQRIQKHSSWIPGVYYNRDLYDCVNYYPYFKEDLLNYDHVMMPFGLIYDRKNFLFKNFGVNNCIFIRPNKGGKQFTGQVLTKENLRSELEILSVNGVLSHYLTVISSPKEILSEWRFVVVDGVAITGSRYKSFGNLDVNQIIFQEEIDFVNKIAKKYTPHPVYIIDICYVVDVGYKLVEINSFSCSGLYACDKVAIINAVGKAALHEWESYQ